jgi:SAM-dependent methyltransferase
MPRSVAGSLARNFLGGRVAGHLRRLVRGTVPSLDWYLSLFAGKSGLEIGGPSQMLSEEGALPVYGVLKSLNNCIFANQTIWEGQVREGPHFKFCPRRQPGFQFILEATDLRAIRESSYECILSCHTLEHVANPFRALDEWKRVSVKGALLLLVLPHKDGIFDWRRPTTSLSHMIEDYNRNVGEDDLTHLSEVLALHDLRKDKAAGSHKKFEMRCLQNQTFRAMHHHVFDTLTAVAMVDHAGLQVLRVDHLRPLHIILVAQCCDRVPDNGAFLTPEREFLRRSPFRG